MEVASPAVVVSCLATLAAVGLAVEDGFSHWTVPAAGPWAVAGGAVTVASGAGVYAALETSPSASLLLSVVAGFAAASWIVVGRLAAGWGVDYRERYFAAAGVGVAAVVLVALVTHLGAPASSLVWVLIVPVAAAVPAAVGFVAFGFLVTDLFTELRLSGLFAVVTVVFEGAASVAAGRLLAADAEGLFASALRPAFSAAGVAPGWWALVAAHLAVGLVIVAVCGRLSRWRTDAGRTVVFVVSVVTLWSGTAVLVSAVTLG
ncbi:hypothetical protein [Natronomonas marina]|jgi:hypothetical protein|uniref:hypothetical protein n=1 Tax=Natronomonas marina TaxID=2961939 RepID=UPI0020C9D520|nr:hypothetical protein [Natronomonas marina]